MDYTKYEKKAMSLLMTARINRAKLVLTKDCEPTIVYDGKNLQYIGYKEMQEMAWFVGNFLLAGYAWDL
jgi:hypothetical protein